MADKKLIDIDRLSKYHENINTLLTTKQESLVSGTNIKTINGESILGSGNIESLASKEYVDEKQDKINDLDEIRAGAAKGATALQSVPSEYVTETELSNKGYATISALNNKVDAISGKQLSTEDFTTALKNKLEGLNNYDDTDLSNALSTLRVDFDNIVSGDTTTAIKTFNEVIAFLDGLTDTQDLESIIASIEQQIAGKMDKVTLSAVATSGNYNDLTNKPTIPAAVTESTVSGWGFTKNTGTYSKPSGGIPKSDLVSAVQTSLGKADTALQSYTEQYKGTVTGVRIDNISKSPSNGVVDLGYIHKQRIPFTDSTITILPNVYYKSTNTSMSSFMFRLGNITNTNIINEYFIEFTTSSSGTTVTLPATVKWVDGVAPTFEAGCTYQISIVDNLGTYIKFA